MAIRVIDTEFDGLKVVVAKAFEDDRGLFMETFNTRDFADAGLPVDFVQDNHSYSTRRVLRGLHYQFPNWQGKLVRVIRGEVFDVAVDIRPESSSRAKWFGIMLTAANRKQLYIPPGFAHGFCVTSEVADVVYKCTRLYDASQDRSILWNDPDIGIEWPIPDPIVSPKDAKASCLRDVSFNSHAQ